MASSRLIFRQCVLEGTIDLANVAPGTVLERSWSVRCNEPPELQEILQGTTYDPRHILRGSDGELWTLGDATSAPRYLAEVATWHPTVNFANLTHRPGGKKIEWSIPDGYSVMLTFTETVVSDELLKILIDSLAERAPGESAVPAAVFNFQGILRGRS